MQSIFQASDEKLKMANKTIDNYSKSHEVLSTCDGHNSLEAYVTPVEGGGALSSQSEYVPELKGKSSVPPPIFLVWSGIGGALRALSKGEPKVGVGRIKTVQIAHQGNTPKTLLLLSPVHLSGQRENQAWQVIGVGDVAFYQLWNGH